MTQPPSGLLLVDKPKGPTSHDVVLRFRRLFPRGTKVGHAGTLDPMATGLLLILIGAATKRSDELRGLPKTYAGAIRFGAETDSGDAEGQVISRAEPPRFAPEQLAQAMQRRVGDLELPPPLYSAVKVNGQALYKYARDGEPLPELKARPCRVERWALTAWKHPDAEFELDCSHGTYVRSLAALLGKDMGCPSHLSALRRMAVGPFRVDDAVDPRRDLRADEAAALLRTVAAAAA